MAAGADLNARFAAEISHKGNRVQIRTPSEQVGVAGGSVALVQFQAIASGITSVLIIDVMVKE